MSTIRSVWNALFGVLARGKRMRRRRSFRPQVEELEGRLVPALFKVTLAGDGNDADPANALNGTLRYCLNEANKTPGSTVRFAVPAGTIIQLTDRLPEMMVSVTIDASDRLNAAGRPTIQIRGGNGAAGGAFDGLILDGGNSVVRGLNFSAFDGTAIVLENRGHDTVQNCFIGTDLTGMRSVIPGATPVAVGMLCSNTGDGIEINNCGNNLIGGGTESEGNVISNNGHAGVYIHGVAAKVNKLGHNIIGTNVRGTGILPNGTGVWIEDASNNIVGGDFGTWGNLISGNHRGAGVLITARLYRQRGVWQPHRHHGFRPEVAQ